MYEGLENADSALFYNIKALNLNYQLKNEYQISISYNNIARIAQKMKDYEKAINYYKKSIELHSKLKTSITNPSKNLASVVTFAYHIKFDNYKTNQFSFAMSLLAIRNTLDGSDFSMQDSDVDQSIISTNYFNTDVGIAYRNEGFFSFYTVKNLLLAKRELFAHPKESTNLRRHLVTIGYFFNKNDKASIKIQPSFMIQYIEYLKELFVDANLKIFIPLNNGEIYGGVSFRKGFDKIDETPMHLTPFFGLKLKNYIVSYSYTKQQNNALFSMGDFHQITLGYNFNLDRYRRNATWDL